MKTMNLIGIALFILSIVAIIGDWNFTASIAVAILGILLTLPASLNFQKSRDQENARLSGYWRVKFAGYLFALAVLVIIFIIQIRNHGFRLQ